MNVEWIRNIILIVIGLGFLVLAAKVIFRGDKQNQDYAANAKILVNALLALFLAAVGTAVVMFLGIGQWIANQVASTFSG